MQHRGESQVVEVVVKPTEIAEVDSIFALRHDRDVLIHQHRPGFFDTPSAFVKKLGGKPNWLGITFRCSSIFADGQMVGHVMQHFGRSSDGRDVTCECGWNLAKDRWGQGIMPRALCQLVAGLFDEAPGLIIYASCFATNHRCQRVMGKVGFERDRMGLVVRCVHWIRGRGRRVEQYRLDRARFLTHKNRLRNTEVHDV